PLALSIAQALKLCLDATDLPLHQIHRLRKRHAQAACKPLSSAPRDKAALASAMRSVAVAASPNFKDLLRARVLASPHFCSLQRLCRAFLHQHLLPHLRDKLGESAFAVQCQPSMRFNLPGSSALGARADDSDEVG
ncbi:MAG: hypothetical protein SGPRY_014035, partial [Prymnesium sp.]